MSVSLYQGNVHARIGEITGGIPLRIRPSSPLFAGQDSVELIVELGDASIPADSAYGLSLQLDYSTADVFYGVGGKASPSFLGIPGNQLISMRRSAITGSTFNIAMVRTDHLPSFGYGEVGRIKLKSQPSVWNAQTKVQLPINVSHCRLIKPDGSYLPISPSVDTVWLYDLGYVAVHNPASQLQWSVSPNPANDVVHIRIDGKFCGKYSLSLIDLSGKLVATQSGHLQNCGSANAIDFDTRLYECGIYALQVSTPKFTAIRRVVILR